MNSSATNDSLVLRPDDDGQLFVIRVLNSGEERVARYCYWALNRRELRFPMIPSGRATTVTGYVSDGTP